jgi:hypothetical protein
MDHGCSVTFAIGRAGCSRTASKNFAAVNDVATADCIGVDDCRWLGYAGQSMHHLSVTSALVISTMAGLTTNALLLGL